MITPKFQELLESYHRKKWFPQKYRDPFEEFIDYISEGMIRDLRQRWHETSNPALLSIVYYIYGILPAVQFRDLFEQTQHALGKTLGEKQIQPNFVLYYLRALPDEESARLWRNFKEWALDHESTFHDLMRATLGFEQKHSDFERDYQRSLQIDPTTELTLEKKLRESRDFFQWEISRTGVQPEDLYSLIRKLRFRESDEIADWNDVNALAKVIAEKCHLKGLPQIQRGREDAVYFLFPIDPPGRVVLEYGTSAGPYDALRAVFELGKGFFYAGMNPELPVEYRICGDPSLALFWGFLYAQLLTDPYSITNMISLKAEAVAKQLKFAMEFSYRYDVALTLFRSGVNLTLQDAQDAYKQIMELAIAVETPVDLYLFDLYRSSDAFWRVRALRCAIAAVRRLEFLEGKHWYASQKFARRFKDYWWEGYRFSLAEVVKDLGVEITEEYPFYDLQ